MAVQSVDRALRLLEAIGDSPGGLADLAQRTELAVSTTSRLLESLESRDAIARRPDGSYVVGPMMKRLAGAESTSTASLQDAAHGELVWLADKLGEAAGLSVPIGGETLTLMQIDTPKPVQAQDWTGHRWGIAGGGSGAVMMATWPNERVEPLLGELSSSDRTELRREIAEARRRGVSWARGVYVEGLTSVAAPVLGAGGEAIAAVIGYGPSYRFPAKGQSRKIEKLVVVAARAITKNLAA